MVSFAHVRTQANDIFISQAGISRCECRKTKKAGTKRVCIDTRNAPALVVAYSPGGQSACLLIAAQTLLGRRTFRGHAVKVRMIYSVTFVAVNGDCHLGSSVCEGFSLSAPRAQKVVFENHVCHISQPFFCKSAENAGVV